ncbi:MAG: uncharacterized protein QOE14_1913 [Humisphaera sp.]|nr:uncharacterized protein [Humisphaera sp.]
MSGLQADDTGNMHFMRSRFIWQRRAALWGSLAVNFYVLIADWVFQPLHGRGLFQPVLAQLNSLSWIASFPAYVIIAKVGIRGALSPPHRLSTSAWFIMWGISLVLWAVALRLFLRILFPVTVERAVETDATHDRVDDTPPDAPATMPVVITTRRRFLTNTARAAVACAALTGGYSMLLETRWFKITRRRHAIRGLRPELSGLRIVQLTDIHHGPALSLNYVREVVAATNALKPDLVLLTGDYVHRSPLYIDPVVRELAELKAKIGVIGVLGNHEWWESAPITRVCFSSAGIPLIDNDRMFVSPDRKLVRGGTDQGLCIAGVGDLIEDRILFDDALRDVPLEMPRLLLSHNPDVAEYPPLVAAARAGGASAAAARIDLMLAGHTHGGQIWMPGLGTLVVPSRFGQKYASGLVQGPVCPVYISRGIGTTVLPLRFGVPPEIAVIELVPA